MKIFALNDLESMDDLIFKKLLANISNEKQVRIKKFARPDDAKQDFAGRHSCKVCCSKRAESQQ